MNENKHALDFRRERRLSLVNIDPNGPGVTGYPCLADCKKPNHRHEHSGSNVFIYARCSCGWEQLVGSHIHEGRAVLEGRLQHLQHQIDAAGEKKP